MDETEYEIYLRNIDRIELENRQNYLVAECRDDDGYVVPGCTYVVPAPIEE